MWAEPPIICYFCFTAYCIGKTGSAKTTLTGNCGCLWLVQRLDSSSGSIVKQAVPAYDLEIKDFLYERNVIANEEACNYLIRKKLFRLRRLRRIFFGIEGCDYLLWYVKLILQQQMWAAACHCAHAVDHSSHAGYQFILVLTSLSFMHAYQYERHIPRVPIRAPVLSSSLSC